MTPQVRTYHHGDLRRALIEEGLKLARTGGPSAIALREATRAAGVSPNAAYRHFADREDLVRAVAREAQLALARAIGERVAAAPPSVSDADAAVERLRRVGLGYIDFARAERGWFETAFFFMWSTITPNTTPSSATRSMYEPPMIAVASTDLVSRYAQNVSAHHR